MTLFGGSKCGHCDKGGTKVVMIEPSGASYKQAAICCSHCSSILGITGFYDTGSLLKDQEKKWDQKFAAVGQKLDQLARSIHQIEQRYRYRSKRPVMP